MRPGLFRRIIAEFVGTLFLLAAVVGSGVMAERLAGGNIALALLANTIATGAALVAIDPCLRSYLRRASEPGGHACRRLAGWYCVAGGPGIYRGTAGRSICRSCSGSSNVRANSIHCVHPRSHRARADVQRVHCYFWFTLCHLGMRKAPAHCCSLRGGCLHYCRLLVHGVYFLRQPSRYPCTSREQHICRYQAGRCIRICRCAVGWGVRGNVTLSMANPFWRCTYCEAPLIEREDQRGVWCGQGVVCPTNVWQLTSGCQFTNAPLGLSFHAQTCNV